MGSVHGQVTTDAGSRLVLRSRLGAITLVLLSGKLCECSLDIADTAIVNVALPSIQHSLGFSQQNLQWVASGYILTYGGFLLLGGRLADLLGRRRVLLAGLGVFAVSSLTAGLAYDPGLLVAARLVQGVGAALMAPAALSELTTSFSQGKDRNTALGVWGAISGMAAAAGVFLGGVLSAGPGWRWVFFVNPPICVLVAAGAIVLLTAGHRRSNGGIAVDSQGAVLATGGMLLLVYSLVRAPVVGWGSGQTVGTLSGSAVLLAAFIVNELRSRNPLLPIIVLRVRGLVAADLTQLIAFCGFFSMFFYATLYMQEVLGYSPLLKAGAAYLPITAGFSVAMEAWQPELVTRHRHSDRSGGLRADLSRLLASTGCPGCRCTAPISPICCQDSSSCLSAPAQCSSRSPPPPTQASQRTRWPRCRAAERLAAGRERPRPGHLVGRSHHPHQRPHRLGSISPGGLGRGLPHRPPGRKHHDGSRCPDRPAHRQHPPGCPAGYGQRRRHSRARTCARAHRDQSTASSLPWTVR